MLKRRKFMTNCAVAVLAVPTVLSCGDDDDETRVIPIDKNAERLQARATQLEAGGVYTTDKPGKWEGKETAHVPTLAVKDGSVTINSTHPMTREHWVTTMYVKDQDNKVIWLKEYLGTDTLEKTFKLPANTTKIIAYAYCNLHDDWKSEWVET